MCNNYHNETPTTVRWNAFIVMKFAAPMKEFKCRKGNSICQTTKATEHYCPNIGGNAI